MSNNCRAKLKDFLELISVGKIQLGLYLKNKLTYGTIVGGILQILLFIGISVYAVFVLIPVFDGTGYDNSFINKSLNTTIDLSSVKNKDLVSKFSTMYTISVTNSTVDDNYCDEKVKFYWYFYDEFVVTTSTITVPSFYQMTFDQETKYNQIVSCYYYLPLLLSEEEKYGNGNGIIYNYLTNQYFLNTSFGVNLHDTKGVLYQLGCDYQGHISTSDGASEVQGYFTFSSALNYIEIELEYFQRSDNIFYTSYDNLLAIAQMKEISVVDEAMISSLSNVIDTNFLISPKIGVATQSRFLLLTALTKVGGLLAFAKILIGVMQLVHLNLYEKTLKQMANKSSMDSDEEETQNLLGKVKPINGSKEEVKESINVDNENLLSENMSQSQVKQQTLSENEKLEKSKHIFSFQNIAFLTEQVKLQVKEIQDLKNEVAILKQNQASPQNLDSISN